MTGNLSGIPVAENPFTEELTAEQIERHYSACMDSVDIINAGKPEGFSDAEWADCVERNKDHLRHMLAKDFWTTQDLEPIRKAVQA